MNEISIDAPVLLFTLAVSLLAGLLFGAIPVLKYAGPRLAATLRAGGRTLSQSKERHRARSTLVVVQVALAMLLLIGSGPDDPDVPDAAQVQPGFTNPEQVQTLRIFIPEAQVEGSGPGGAHGAEHPGQDRGDARRVSRLAFTSYVPMDGSGWHDPIFARGPGLRRIADSAAAHVSSSSRRAC